MARGKMDTPEQIVSLLRQIEVAVGNGKILRHCYQRQPLDFRDFQLRTTVCCEAQVLSELATIATHITLHQREKLESDLVDKTIGANRVRVCFKLCKSRVNRIHGTIRDIGSVNQWSSSTSQKSDYFSIKLGDFG
jgi:hypothetical protein